MVKKSRGSTFRVFEKIGAQPPIDGRLPLECPEHEAFAQAFWRTCDGKAAAIEAGYPEGAAPQIWPELLRREDLQARLKALQIGVPQPVGKRKAVFDEIMAQAFVDISSIISINPRTGAPSFDLHNASERQMNALDFEEVIVEFGGRTRRTTRIRTPDRFALIRMAARSLGVETPSDVEEPEDALMQLSYISSRQSFADSYRTSPRG